jgi:type I restriction enzyme S subunit
MAAVEVAPEDILIVKDGATTGKTAFVGCLSERAFVNEHVFVVRPNEDALPKYLFYWLWSQPGFEQIMLDFRGTAQGGIGRTFVDKVAVPWVPVACQRKIVARIDEMFAAMEDGEENLRRARQELETFGKSLLKEAVTGQLTADWRHSATMLQTGAELVQCIRSGRGLTMIEPARLENIPHHWTAATIGDLFRVFVGTTPSRGEASYWGGAIPWVSSGEVGFCRIGHTRERITEAALKGSSERIHPPGTVMLGMIGEGKTRGQAAILDVAAAHNQNCASIRVSETPIPPEFVYYVLRERYEETRIGSSGGNQPALNKSRVQAIPIPVPPLAECKEIVRRLKEGEDEAKELADVLASTERGAASLRQSILGAAFRGELV